MTDLQMTLSDEERQYLVTLLEMTLKDALVEEHRTRTPSYRQNVLDREEIIRSILAKVRCPD